MSYFGLSYILFVKSEIDCNMSIKLIVETHTITVKELFLFISPLLMEVKRVQTEKVWKLPRKATTIVLLNKESVKP